MYARSRSNSRAWRTCSSSLPAGSCGGNVVNALIIARHHLVRLIRSPGLIVILAAIPITLALIDYAAFRATVASGKLPPVKVLLLVEDQTYLSRAAPRLFSAG